MGVREGGRECESEGGGKVAMMEGGREGVRE